MKGQIELVSDFKILAQGEKARCILEGPARLQRLRSGGAGAPGLFMPQVSASGAVLLGKLGIRPFEYKIEAREGRRSHDSFKPRPW